MLAVPRVTRFAPSPTGFLHLGNARTAFFNFLAARSGGGRLVLRIEDTDAERSDAGLLARLLEDLRWLGIEWDEGPDVGGPHALVYPCFCTQEELQLARRAQLAAGRPPRYAGTCARLAPDEVERHRAAGRGAALRFRVPSGRVVEFTDAVHGPQRFATDDIGDFVVTRADGSAAFFLGNAIDDADMGVTLVLRGDDHLANTPRQVLLLEALGRRVPSYGHLPLVLAPTGAPLSKREGAAGLHELRDQGYQPAALRNYLLRVGHTCGTDAWLEAEVMPAHFDLGRVSHSPARFDEAQLRHWQREAVQHSSVEALADWLGTRLDALGTPTRKAAFVSAVRGNLLFPSDAESLVRSVVDDVVVPDAEAATAIADAGPDFFAAAIREWASAAGDFKAWTRAVGAATTRKGAALFMPLRAALTGTTHGPELAPLVALMGVERVTTRLEAARALAG